MITRRKFKKTANIGALSAVLAFVAWGCGDNTAEKLRAAKLAQGCTINSDCEGALVCVFERCHVACKEDEDCTDPLRCVRGKAETNVCQLDDEVGCDRDKDCKGGQVCGVDEECRDPCRDDDECIADQICAASNECASTDPEKDELDPEGNILPDGGGAGGAGGSGGAPAVAGATNTAGSGGTPAVAGASNTAGSENANGGENAIGGETATGGSGAAGGGGASAGESSASAGEASGSAGEASGGSGTGPVGDYVETSDGVEAVNNNDRDHAIPASATSSLFLASGDEDWLKVSAPDDGRAHVIELGLQQEAGLRTSVQALAGADFAQIGAIVNTMAGVTTQIYVTVGPGTTTLLRFWPYVGPGKRLELTMQMSAEQDENEPNNTPDTATSIEVNTPITGQFINPFASATSQAIDDWYAVELTQGTATLNLLQAPLGGRFYISRQNEQNVSTEIQRPSPGVTGLWSFPVPATGTYWIGFAAYTGFSPFVEGLKPSYLSEPYVFEVQQ